MPEYPPALLGGMNGLPLPLGGEEIFLKNWMPRSLLGGSSLVEISTSRGGKFDRDSKEEPDKGKNLFPLHHTPISLYLPITRHAFNGA